MKFRPTLESLERRENPTDAFFVDPTFGPPVQQSGGSGPFYTDPIGDSGDYTGNTGALYLNGTPPNPNPPDPTSDAFDFTFSSTTVTAP